MSWNYRVCKIRPKLSLKPELAKLQSDYYALKSVYYSATGEPDSYNSSETPVNLEGFNSREGLIDTLELMLKDAKERTVLFIDDDKEKFVKGFDDEKQ